MDSRFAMIVELPGEFDEEDGIEKEITDYVSVYCKKLADRISIVVESAEEYRETDREWQPEDEEEDDSKPPKIDWESEDEDEGEDEDDEDDDDYDTNYWKIIVTDAPPDQTETVRALIREVINDSKGFYGFVIDDDCEDDDYAEETEEEEEWLDENE